MSDLLYKHYAHGKLLLSGEYFVLDGAKALAIPTKYGQLFKVYETPENASGNIVWKSYNNKNSLWLEVHLNFKNKKVELVSATDDAAGERLKQLLNVAFQMSDFEMKIPLEIQTYLEFPNEWGLGSSSTLLTSVAKWLMIDPYELMDKSFGGSGYDIACATADSPIFYKRKKGVVEIDPIDLNYPFLDSIYFVYLDKKQDSREGIEQYKTRSFEDKQELINMISGLTEGIAHSLGIDKFINLLYNHECVISNNVELEKVQDRLFDDFDGLVKSLGAWGGDFVMAVSHKDEEYIHCYFKGKGLETVIPYKKMILKNELVG